MSLEKRLKDIKTTTSANGIKLVLRPVTYFRYDGGTSVGYFCGEDWAELGVATYRNAHEVIGILEHEYKHFLQWLTDDERYHDNYVRGRDTMDILIDVLEGRLSHETDTAQLAISMLRELERDANVGAASAIKQYHPNVNLELFIRRSAADLLSFTYAQLFGKWPQRGVLQARTSRKVLNQMPSTLRGKFTSLTKKQIAAFEEFAA